MYALRKFSTLLKDERFTKYQRTHQSPSELARQSGAKRKQAPQSEANVCRRRRCNLKKTSNCTGHPVMHSKQQTTQIRGCVLVPRTQLQ